MNGNNPNDNSEGLWERRARRFKKAGIIVLLAGILGAGLVYWLGSRPPDPAEDASMIGFDKTEQRQMGEMYGSWGTTIEGFQDDLKHPGTQAAIILVVAGIIAAGCFYLSEPPNDDEPAAGGNDAPHA